MPVKEDIENKITAYFNEPYETHETSIVPDTDYSKLTFNNKGLIANLTFLFIDIRNSSNILDIYKEKYAAIIYQCFHEINVRLILSRGGKVRSFDGDRTMGVFSGDRKNPSALDAAMNIRWAISNILNKKLELKKYPGIKVGLGIDTGRTLITKVGKGGDINNSDLNWISKASNHASHLCQNAEDLIIISPEIFNNLPPEYKSSKGQNIWNNVQLTIKNNKTISAYKTNYWMEEFK